MYDSIQNRHKIKICALFLLSLFIFVFFAAPASAKAQKSSNKTLRVIYTTRLDGQIASKNGQGGAAKIASFIQANRTANTLVIDGGTLGDNVLYAPVYGQNGYPWQWLKTMGDDVTLLSDNGRMVSTAQQLKTLKAQKAGAPVVLYGGDNRALARQIKRTAVLKKGKIKVGILAVSSGQNDLKILNQVRQDVKKLKNCDVIVAVSTLSQKQNKMIARFVPCIAVIVDGASGESTDDPVFVGKTAIVSAGTKGRKVGVMDYSVAQKQVKTNGLIAIGREVKADSGMKAQVDQLNDALKQTSDPGRQITTTQKDFMAKKDRVKKFADNDTGNLVSDAYRAQAKNAVGVVAESSLNRPLKIGGVTVSNAADMFSRKSGHLIKLTVSGQTLREICEYDATAGYLNPAKQLYFSGLRYDYMPTRTLFNRVTGLEVKSGGKWQTVSARKSYTVITDENTAEALSKMKLSSKHKMTLNSLGAQAAVQYLDKLGQQGVSDLSAAYITTANHKTPEAFSFSNWSRYFSHPSRIGVLTYGVVIFILVLIVGSLVLRGVLNTRWSKKDGQQLRKY
ncbi:MAG: 5'-nucleotidase C-terminal domain-containing protein [Pseudoramibacter sp.]